jgi:serine/threonine-protein kinase
MNGKAVLLPGKILAGRYRIVRRAGEGGMAVVFEATDLKHNRSVAVKVLRGELATQVGSERFRREIGVLAKLSHPNIVPLFESGESDGLLFYVMPFVDGEGLDARLAREGKLPIVEAVRIAREVSRALSYAHKSGIVHRDLKPSNIMLSGGAAVVTDFGIARFVEDIAQDRLTFTGIAIGTPAYMSPEQGMGTMPVSPRSDQYSLACVLYEMLAGEKPYSGLTPLATLAMHSTATIPDIRQSRLEVPPAMAATLYTALSKNPDERFATIEAFVAALESTTSLPDISLGGLESPASLRVPNLAAPVSSGSITLPRAGAPPADAGDATELIPPPSPPPKRRGPLLALGVAVLVAVVGVVAWLVTRSRAVAVAPRQPVVAVLNFDHQGPPDEKYLTDGITDELSQRISDVNGIRVVSRASAVQYDLHRQSLQEIGAALKVTHVLTGSVRTDRRPDGTRLLLVSPRLVDVASGADIWTDRITMTVASGEIFRAQSRIASGVARALDVALSPEAMATLAALPTQDMQAYSAFLRGNLHATQFLVGSEQEQAIADMKEAVRLDPQFAVAQARLAQLEGIYLSAFGKTPDRLAEFKASVDRAMQLAPNLPQTRIALGMWYAFGDGDRARALNEYEGVLRRQPNNADLLVQIGRLYRAAGDHAAAFTNFERAAQLDPRSLTNLFEAGVALFMSRRLEEGIAYLERALAISPDWVPAKLGISEILVFEGKTAEANQRIVDIVGAPGVMSQLIGDPLYRFRWEVGMPPVYDQRLERISLAEANVDSAEYYRAKGRLYARRGDQRLERIYFDSVLSVLQGRRRAFPVGTLTHVDLGLAYAEVGATDKARVYADSARVVGGVKSDRFRGWFASWDIARLYAQLGERDKAIAVLREIGAADYPAFLRVDPEFAPLRGQPGFEALLRGGT